MTLTDSQVNDVTEQFKVIAPKLLDFIQTECEGKPLFSVISAFVYALDQALIPQLRQDESITPRQAEEQIIEVCNTLLESVGARFRLPDIDLIDNLADQTEENILQQLPGKGPPGGH